jgi:hypothetical protein
MRKLTVVIESPLSRVVAAPLTTNVTESQTCLMPETVAAPALHLKITGVSDDSIPVHLLRKILLAQPSRFCKVSLLNEFEHGTQS